MEDDVMEILVEAEADRYLPRIYANLAWLVPPG